MTVAGVVFDLGGVVLESPMEAIADFERRNGLAAGAVNRAVATAGHSGAWARHERGELDRSGFLDAFGDELGHDVTGLLDAVDAAIRIRPEVVRRVDLLRGEGAVVAALTNNWTPFGDDPVVGHFDVVVESVVEGTRKPEPEIYRICVERMGLDPRRCLMFDDLGVNLKPARALGMATVKVTSERQLLAEIDRLLSSRLEFGPIETR